VAGLLHAAVGVGEVPRLIVSQDTAMPKIAAIYAETPIATDPGLAGLPHRRRRRRPRLSRRFADAQWEFRRATCQGQPDAARRDKRGISFAEGMLGEAVGRQYVADYFPAESKAKMEQLVANLRTALGNRIRQPTPGWAPRPSAAAEEKLNKFTVKIGYPNKWRDYSALEIRPADLFGNAERAGHLPVELPAEPPEPAGRQDEWGMTPQTVNAYYNSSNNEIVFPAAILQPPFFDPGADPAVNYGGIGGVIGHEIGHGFDDQGSKSDGDGVLRDWWTPQDKANFDRP
jgi:putative endopeptidase